MSESLIDSLHMSKISSSAMSKRLQVLFDEAEFLEIQESARRCRMTVAEWVRQGLRRARHDHPAAVDAKLAAVAEAANHEFPTADIDVMLREIEADRDTA